MKHTKAGLLALDALCAGVLALGACLVLLPAWGLPAAPGIMIISILILLALLVLSLYRPWLAPAVLGGAALLAAGGAFLTGHWEAFSGAVVSYGEWAVGESVNGSPQLPVYLLAALPAAASWGLVRWGDHAKAAPLWVVTLLAAALITYKAVWMPEGWLAPVLLLFAGVMIFLPRATLGEAGRLQAKLLAALLTLPVLGLAVLIGPKADGGWQSAAVGHLVRDTQDFWAYHFGQLPGVPLTGMRRMGLQPEAEHLGGDIELGDDTVFTSSQNLLLRGQALDFYTGSGWTDALDSYGGFRFDSFFWQGRRQEAFGLDVPPPVSKPLLERLLTDVDADVRSPWAFRSVFLPYRPQTVEPRGEGEISFNMQGEAYWQAPPEGMVEYRLEGQTWNLLDPEFDKNVLLFEQALEDSPHGDYFNETVEHCLQLPDALPEWVADLAAELTEGFLSPYGKALALRDYLRETCEYTLAPGPTDPDQDFVAEFLTHRRGYCTYYASALTVLCRAAGVPARYVTGYAMIPDGERYKATESTAHAWAEVYLDSMGWVPVDALTADIFTEDKPLPQGAQAGSGAPMGPAATPTPEPYGGSGELPPLEAREEGGFNPLLLLWAVPVLAAAGGVLAAKKLRSGRYRYAYVQKKFPQAGPAAEHCCAGLMRLLRILRLRPGPGETLLAFWRRMGETLPREMGTDWEEVGRIMDRLRFGGADPDQDEVAALCRAYQALEAYIPKSMGLLGRILV